MGIKAFDTAIYRNGDFIERINLCDLSKESYQAKYRNHLYCPNKKCDARLKFVLRKNGTLPILQSINIHEHIKGCPFYFEYKRYDSDEKVSKIFSPEHISNSLKRRMHFFGVDNSKNYKSISREHSQKSIKRRSEPNIQYYNVENVNANVEAKAISVEGFIKSVKIVDVDPNQIHAYINFDLPDKKVSVFISHNRYLQDKQAIDIVERIRETWKNTPENKQCVCICFGWIKCVEKGINVVPVNLHSIRTGYKLR